MSAATTLRRAPLPYTNGYNHVSSHHHAPQPVASDDSHRHASSNVGTPQSNDAYLKRAHGSVASATPRATGYYGRPKHVSYRVERDGPSELLVLDDTPPRSAQATPDSASSRRTTYSYHQRTHDDITDSYPVPLTKRKRQHSPRADGVPSYHGNCTNGYYPHQYPPPGDVRAHYANSKLTYYPNYRDRQDAKRQAPLSRPSSSRAGKQYHMYTSENTTQSGASEDTREEFMRILKPPSHPRKAGVKRPYDGSHYDDQEELIVPKIPRTHHAAPGQDEDGHVLARAGECLAGGRYKVVRLLGKGTFGKVYECLDKTGRKKVAVKVIRAVKKYRDASKVEIKVLNMLKECDPQNDNKCIHLVDMFDDNNHICLVSELLSSSVYDFLKRNKYSPFPPSHIQSFARQMLQSVAFLHDLNLIHTDLKPENVLLVDDSYEFVQPKYPRTKKKAVLKSSQIRLIDFGSATFQDGYHADVVSTRHYRAPEIILGLGWSFPCDAWSIGCILVELYTGQALFQTHENLEHLAMMEVVLGPMPSRWARLAARNKPEWFRPCLPQESPALDYPNAQVSRQSRKYVRGMKSLDGLLPSSNLINGRLKDLLRGLLTWQPYKRLTVKEALRHPFFALQINDEASEIPQPPDASLSTVPQIPELMQS